MGSEGGREGSDSWVGWVALSVLVMVDGDYGLCTRSKALVRDRILLLAKQVGAVAGKRGSALATYQARLLSRHNDSWLDHTSRTGNRVEGIALN